MDHLILPRNPRRQVQKVALLSAEEYDGGDFLTYPERQGWGERTADEWFTMFRCPAKHQPFVAFLERWLLFGMISAFCNFFQVEFKPSDFIGFKDGVHPIFTTHRFPNLLQQITDRGPSMNLGPDGAAAALSSFYTSCATHIRLTHPGDDDAHINDDSRQRRLHEFINTFQNSIKNPRQRGITMATSIIMESVLESTSVMLERLINQHRSIKIRSFHDTNGLMERRLRQDGWCPSEFRGSMVNSIPLAFTSFTNHPDNDPLRYTTTNQLKLPI